VSVFDESLALTAAGPGRWAGIASPRYEAVIGVFGGWTVALLLKAVLAEPEASGSPVSITVNFIAALPPGADIVIDVVRLGATRSLAHWRCDLRLACGDSIVATAIVIMAKRRASDSRTEPTMPDVPPPEELPGYFPPFAKNPPMESRSPMPPPPFNNPDSRTVNWEREASGRAIDMLTLALLSDLGAPRVYLVSPGPRPSATLTLSVTFLAGPEELAACGDDFILADMIATRIEQSTVGSRKDMWSRAGTLLATSEQLCWFR